jgi:hypothetical protein
MSSGEQSVPQIKFLKGAVEDILAGGKTMEARPRSLRWIDAISRAGVVELTFGPRFKPPTVFALAEIELVVTKPFSEATAEDVRRFGGGWQDKGVEAFIAVHERWYAAELSEGKPVGWIYFHLLDVSPRRHQRK